MAEEDGYLSQRPNTAQKMKQILPTNQVFLKRSGEQSYTRKGFFFNWEIRDRLALMSAFPIESKTFV